MNLLIVESPTKAKTIARYLGSGWKVVASLGHIKDLPKDSMGVDLETLTPRYVWIHGKKKMVEKIKRLAKRAKIVYLGTDPDREGEAISYFLKEELQLKGIKRIRFYEITKETIEDAIKKAGDIDLNLVYSQFARRILDRLIGYRLSPYLWREFGKNNLSVGRVQSPALKLIVEREMEVQSFEKKKYYYVKATFEKDGIKFEATFKKRFEKPEDAEAYLQNFEGSFFEIKEQATKTLKLSPPKPFNTASLQATASKELRKSIEQVQKIAQKLFEKGYITYPRTDSYRMNENKAKEFMEFIKKSYGEEYIGMLRRFKDRARSQGAHECIRPTSLYKSPTEKTEMELFEAIKRRTLASLSSPMEVKKQVVTLSPVSFDAPFECYGMQVLFDGFSKIEGSQIEERRLPNLEKGEVLRPERVYVEEVSLGPPPRYTEGMMVKTLEKLGIGRPSTYSSIVSTLIKRGYVRTEGGVLKPTEIAFHVTQYLNANFERLMDYNFTKLMELSFDAVEEGKRDWKDVVGSFYRGIILNRSNDHDRT
ncbi:MAG: type I DNA topoisomerase [Aquificaceae bacterium]